VTCIENPAHGVCARINGRVLSRSIRVTKARSRFGKINPTEWIDICPECDAYILGCDLETKTPFLSGDQVMRTIEDYDLNSRTFKGSSLNFCGLKLSYSALINGARLVRDEFLGIDDLEALGRSMGPGSNHQELIDFSNQVCIWGGGERVWGNLNRFHQHDELARIYLSWFSQARITTDPEEAIQEGLAIKGLGVSFASKHLRMLKPDEFAVLDDVLSVGLGFALNVKGYGLFMRSLRNFIEVNNLSLSISEVEAGIFFLVRQLVRSNP
jgi:hypothetical protein